jgi:hypothetical protein
MYDPHTHSFVTKIWLEETEDEAGRAVWRGTITHVPSGARRYLRTLGDITAYIVPYLRGMGVRTSFWWQVREWLTRWGR